MTSKKPEFLNKARRLEHQINQKLDQDIKKHTLNEQIIFIETTYNSLGAIDKHKMDASAFKSWLNKAIEKVEKTMTNGNN